MNQRLRSRLRGASYTALKLVTELGRLVPRKGLQIPFLVYHRVCPLNFPRLNPYANVYPEEFDAQMSYLRERFDALTISEFVNRALAGTLAGNETCVTFDDGFKDNYLFAYPILKKYGLRATFFVTTAYIGADTVFPWMKLDHEAEQDVSRHRHRWLPLSWEEVCHMMEDGMEFGTHTHTHRVSLAHMSTEEAEREISECTRTFRIRTGVQPLAFSYPHGTVRDYGSEHVSLLKEYGYRCAVTTNAGRNSPTQDPFELRRLIVYEEDPLREFKKKLHGAYDVASSLQRVWLKVAGS